MNIDQLSGKRFDVALELFIEGKSSITYRGIVFYREKNKLSVNSYSDFLLENTTRDMAIEKIEYSKIILDEMMKSVPQFSANVEGLEKEYAFCYDYQTGAVALAVESNSKIKWIMDLK